jgi:hypothetical protein
LKNDNRLLETEFQQEQLTINTDFISWSDREGKTIEAEKSFSVTGLPVLRIHFLNTCLLPLIKEKR